MAISALEKRQYIVARMASRIYVRSQLTRTPKASFPLLVDCDGVLLDFSAGVAAAVADANVRGMLDGAEDIRVATAALVALADAEGYSAFGNLTAAGRQLCYRMIESVGFHSYIPEMSGAIATLRRIRELSSFQDIMCLTSPWHTSTSWMTDRARVLQEKFDIGPSDITHCRRKELVAGIALIDDKAANVERWVAENYAQAIWFQRGQPTPPEIQNNENIYVASNWASVFFLLQDVQKTVNAINEEAS